MSSEGLILKVDVEYLGHIRNVVGSKRHEEVEIENGSSIADLLSILAEKHGEPFKESVYEPKETDVKSNYIITVNGCLLNQLSGIQTNLREGDHITILPIVSGG